MRQRGKGFTFIVWLDFCTSDSNSNLKITLFLPAWNNTGNSEHPVTRLQNTSNNKKKPRQSETKFNIFQVRVRVSVCLLRFTYYQGFRFLSRLFRCSGSQYMPFLPTQLGSGGFFKSGLTYNDGNSIRNNYFLINWIILFLFIKERVEPPYYAPFCNS